MSISRQEQIEILRKMTDREIDLCDPDAPPLSDQDLQKMSLFIPPQKRTSTIKLDSDILRWFKEQKPQDYQTLINAVLRDYILKHGGALKQP
jgi:uncharacterized protein (DUF4415 family)